MDQPSQKTAADGVGEDCDDQGHNPSIVLHAQVWSRASTLQLVTDGSAANNSTQSNSIAPLQERLNKLTRN